jgi:integrase
MPRKRGRGRRGEGSVYWSTTQQRYVAEATIGYSKDGARIRKVLVGPRGRKDNDAELGLKERLERFQKRANRPTGKPAVTSRETLEQYLKRWIKQKAADELSEAAAANYTWAIDRYLIPHLGQTPLYDLSREQFKAFFHKLNLADSSKEKIRTVLRAALQHAVDEDGILFSNPAARLKIHDPKRRRKRVKTVAVWNASQARHFLRTVKGSEHFALFLVAIVGALGPAELFGLHWRDVDLEHGRIAIEANLTEVGGHLVLKETKTDSRRRNVALPGIALKALKNRYARLKPRPGDFVFTAPEGGPIRRTLFRSRVWLPLIRKAGLPPITLYGLRHSSASLMASMGIPILIASRALGHSNIRTTADVYSHLFDDSQREVAAKFEGLLKGL